MATSMKYAMYKSGIITAEDFPCPANESNHQVTFVGYGKFKGKEVWVL